jgi:hypothetical protein
MLITKLHLESHYLSAYLYYSNPTTSSTTNYLPISKFNKKYHYKSMDDGKVYANFAYNAIKQTEGMALISHLRRIKLAYRKEPKVFMH